MDRLTPAARAVLDLARDSHDPTLAQRVRADAAVRIGLALNGVTDLPPLDPPVHAPHPAAPPVYPPQHAAPAAASVLSKLSWTSGWKLGVAGGALLFAGMFVAHNTQPTQHAAQSALPGSMAPAAVPAGAPGATPALPAGVTATTLTQALAVADPETSPARALGSARSTRLASLRGGVRLTAAPARSRAAASAVSEADLQAEVALIGAADELIRAHHYDGALRVLASHAQRFPRGALREERDALRLLSQCGNGLDARSERAVARFLRTEPRSVVAQRMREACALSESP